MRFLYQEWGIAPFSGNGDTIKDHYPAGSMVFYPNGSHAIVPGDIVTEQLDACPGCGGHAVVVTSVALDGNGTGTINILEQNSSSGGLRPLSVENWSAKKDAWTGYSVQGWLHVKANQPNGDADPAFTPGSGPDGRVSAISLQSDNKILIGGEFAKFNGIARARVARLDGSGSLDTSFDPGAGVTSLDNTPHVYALQIQSADGKVLIGGHFDHYQASARNNIARLDNTGALDGAFDPGTGITRADGNPSSVYAMAIQIMDGKLLIAGDFDRFNGTPKSYLARLNSNGSLDTSFTGVTDGIVYAIAVQTDGKIIIGGAFSKVNGTARSGIARLTSTGSLDPTFDPGGAGTLGAVRALALQEDKILIGGNFSQYDGTSRAKIARLNGNGSLDGTFNPGTGLSGTSDLVQTIATQPDGRILIGGEISIYNGTPLNHLGRLNYDGSLETTFYPRPDGEVDAMVLQPDNKIIIGGNFTGHLARLLNHIEPCYTLSIVANPAVAGSVTASPATNCPGGKYINATTVQLTAVPRKDLDYWWLNWSGNITGSANPVSVSMTGDRSVTANFMHSPGFFNKLLPANAAPNQPANPNLSWEASVGATSYEYCLDRTNNDTCDSGNWITTGSNLNVSLNNLLPSVSYYWQVRSRNQVDTTDANTGAHWWSFTRSGVPVIPVTVSPNGVNFIGSQPPFVWNAPPGATSYHLIVYSLDTSSNAFEDDIDSPACTSGVCTYQVAEELPAGNYEFKVSARSGTPGAYSDFSEYSAWRSFNLVVGQKFYLPLVIK